MFGINLNINLCYIKSNHESKPKFHSLRNCKNHLNCYKFACFGKIQIKLNRNISLRSRKNPEINQNFQQMKDQSMKMTEK